jgi:hypothetical protein
MRTFNLILSLFICLLTQIVYSQNNPYKTSSDFSNDNLTAHYKHLKMVNLFRKQLIYKDSLHHKIVYKIRKDSLWGYKDMHGNIIRFINTKHWAILSIGEICVYGKLGEYFVGKPILHTIQQTNGSPITYLQKYTFQKV